MVTIICTFCLSVVVGLILTRSVRNYANTRGWALGPKSARHIHKRPIARLGGVAIFVSCYGTVASALMIASAFHVVLPVVNRQFVYLGVAAAMIFAIGLCDDVRSLSPRTKLLVEACGGSVLYLGGFRIVQVGMWYQHDLGNIIGYPATIVWVILITNAFNLIDGMDGLAAGSALISTAAVFLVSITGHNFGMSLATAALAGSIAGFLRFNVNPASIFLGDCGSLFIGFVLAAVSISTRQKAPTLVAIAIPMVAFGLPLVETALSVFRRVISGRSPFSPDRDHIHHKLLRHGLSQRKAVYVLYGATGFCALMSLLLVQPEGKAPGLIMLVFGVSIVLFVHHLGYVEFSELQRVAQRALEQRQIIVNDLAIRRASSELSLCHDLPSISRVIERAFSANAFDAVECCYRLEYPVSRRLLNVAAGGEDEIRVEWKRDETICDYEWRLNLSMVASTGELRGVVTVCMVAADRPLLFDVNLLNSSFRVALADAMDRAILKEPVAAGVS